MRNILHTKIGLVLVIELVVLCLVAYLAFLVNSSNNKLLWEFGRSDVLVEYNQALEIGAGQNPYNKILSGDLLINRKYATLFPLYYYFLFVIAAFSGYAFDVFILNYRNMLFVAELVAGLFIYLNFRRVDRKLLGITAVCFFFFNRWTLETFSDMKQDFIAIAFLTASLYFFNNKKSLAFLLYGFSLGIKHLGIFVLPIYLTPLLFREVSLKVYMYHLFLMFIPTFGISLPFIIQNYKSFLFSMLFSFTRKPATTSVAFGYDKLLVLYKVGVENNTVLYYLLPRIPLVIFYILNTTALFMKSIPRSFFALTAMFGFMAFNPVLFDQYITWLTPLLFFGIVDLLEARKHGKT